MNQCPYGHWHLELQVLNSKVYYVCRLKSVIVVVKLHAKCSLFLPTLSQIWYFATVMLLLYLYLPIWHRFSTHFIHKSFTRETLRFSLGPIGDFCSQIDTFFVTYLNHNKKNLYSIILLFICNEPFWNIFNFFMAKVSSFVIFKIKSLSTKVRLSGIRVLFLVQSLTSENKKIYPINTTTARKIVL